MSDILIITLIIAAGLAYVFLRDRKGGPSNPIQINQQTNQELYKPVIEDNSHLKAELAEAKLLYSTALQQMGQLQSEVTRTQKVLEVKSNQHDELVAKFDKLQHQNKSSQVKTGTFVEILSPIAEQFPVDPKTMRFLGSPIDYISFDYDTDMITFVEVKSGESQLNSNQKAVKSMIERGRVQFKTVRLNEKGIKIK